ncbi:Integrase catalytic domain-containing protein [Aphis craccivora]|uniref:Integrase catalytic domain-containing protein n=1 Tax=Aphis craccivora TaxID=307492 RepID=A0A6G0ZDN7_APHCR|nr:Integrase catalytic domain-containing protein [Aphis craccivora]
MERFSNKQEDSTFIVHIKSDDTVYDPIGLISPDLILGKVFVHQFWRLKLEWDEPLSNNLITPLRATTILRLELCGALLLAELISEIKTELSLLNITTPADIYF